MSTHDELAAQLKIAQSNLTLAETHSEFLEETLRRRETSNGSNSNGTGRNSSSMNRGGARANAQDEIETSSGGGGARSFFRLPGGGTTNSSSSSTGSTTSSNRRKPTIPPTPLSFVSAHSTPGLRSVASSPRLGGGSTSPIPPSPIESQPRFSTSTISSFESNHSRPSLSLSPNPSTQSLPLSPSNYPSLQDFTSLQTAFQQLDAECSALRVSEESMKRNNEMMVKKCVDLEKTKEDLMSELENLSVELFSEANALVSPHPLSLLHTPQRANVSDAYS